MAAATGGERRPPQKLSLVEVGSARCRRCMSSEPWATQPQTVAVAVTVAKMRNARRRHVGGGPRPLPPDLYGPEAPRLRPPGAGPRHGELPLSPSTSMNYTRTPNLELFGTSSEPRIDPAR
jgi:hypothetical protein